MAEDTQRVVSIFVGIATALFAAGVAFGYAIVLPRALKFLTEYDDELYDVQIRASYYYGFVTRRAYSAWHSSSSCRSSCSRSCGCGFSPQTS